MSTQIQSRRKILGLSQEDMAKSLGISRPTYVKLEQGVSKPTQEQEVVLSQILKMPPETFRQQNNESLIPPDTVEIRKVPTENEEKFQQVLLYILGKVGSRPNIGQTALYKILYFIDFDYYEKFEEQLIGATYIKNTYGPTPISFAKLIQKMQDQEKIVEVKSKYFDLNQTKYIPVQEVDVSSLSGQELQHINDELERLAHLSARQLSELSHKDTPWKVAKERSILNYEHVFYRAEETSVRDYEEL